MSIDYKAAGKRIKAARNKKGISQEYLAVQVGVTPTHISNIETGNASMSLALAVSISNELNITLDEMLSGSIVKNKHINIKDIRELLEDCSDRESRILAEIMAATKTAIRRE